MKSFDSARRCFYKKLDLALHCGDSEFEISVCFLNHFTASAVNRRQNTQDNHGPIMASAFRLQLSNRFEVLPLCSDAVEYGIHKTVTARFWTELSG
jgi:hypothetical protein